MGPKLASQDLSNLHSFDCLAFYPLFVVPCRYYDKSKIEEEIKELRRSGGREHWKETKRSIKDARFRLSLQRNSLNIDGLDSIQPRSLSSNGTMANGMKFNSQDNNHQIRSHSMTEGHQNYIFMEDCSFDQVING